MTRNVQPHVSFVNPTTITQVGEPLTLAEAFRRFSPYVARIGTRILGHDSSEIDDLVQDVFTEATTGLRTATNAAALRGWLATVTVRVAIRRLRRRKLRRFLFLEDMANPVVLVSTAADPEQQAIVTRVYAALDRLSLRKRAAWILRHVEGQSLDEVAQSCDCSLATAKRQIAAAEEWIERNVRR